MCLPQTWGEPHSDLGAEPMHPPWRDPRRPVRGCHAVWQALRAFSVTGRCRVRVELSDWPIGNGFCAYSRSVGYVIQAWGVPDRRRLWACKAFRDGLLGSARVRASLRRDRRFWRVRSGLFLQLWNRAKV